MLTCEINPALYPYVFAQHLWYRRLGMPGRAGKLYILASYMYLDLKINPWTDTRSQAFVTAFNGIGLAVVYYGAGKHIEHVSQEHLSKWFMVCPLLCLYGPGSH